MEVIVSGGLTPAGISYRGPTRPPCYVLDLEDLDWQLQVGAGPTLSKSGSDPDHPLKNEKIHRSKSGWTCRCTCGMLY